MKEQIKAEDINEFRYHSNIFAILLLLTIILPIPLMKFMGYIGIGNWVLIAITSICYSIRIEKYKKNFNIQTYREILDFLDGKNMNDLEKNQEYGKRPYQKFLLAIGSGLLAIIVTVIMSYILF